MDITLIAAAGGSLALHALLLVSFRNVRVEGPGVALHRAIPREMRVTLVPEKPPGPTPPSVDPPAPASAMAAAPKLDAVLEQIRALAAEMQKIPPADATPAESEKSKEEAPEFVVGDEKGTGYATHEVKSDRVASAPLAESDQPFMSRDPAGDFGSAAAMTLNQGGGGNPRPAAQAAAPAMRPPPAPPIRKPQSAQGAAVRAPAVAAASLVAGAAVQPPGETAAAGQADLSRSAASIQSSDVSSQTPAPKSERVPTPVISPPPTAPPAARAADANEKFSDAVAQAIPAPALPPSPAEAANRPAGPKGEVGPSVESPNPQRAAGDPAPPTDSEVDPFSQFGGATVSDGRLEVQAGRKVKPRRIKLLLSGMIDAATLGDVRVVAWIAVDETGKVKSVQITRSSGSNELDLATRVSLYDWWFEPKKVDGQYVADAFNFGIHFR